MPFVARGLPLLIFVLLLALPAQAAPPRLILTSTFPIYQMTRNIVQGQSGVTVELLLPAPLGCPHDYALTPQDMQKLRQAEVLIINGLGLEEFLGAPLQRAHPGLVVIDSSRGLDGLLYDGDASADEPDHDHDHGHGAANPHLFASPRMAARQVLQIAAELARLDPAAAPLYQSNADAYAGRLDALADEFVALGKTLNNRRVITQHSVFAYLARDMGLEVVAVVQEHPGQEPAAAEMLTLIRQAKAREVGGLFSEPQYPAKVAETIAREAGIPHATLDPAASGADDAPLNSYQTTMRNNLQTLKSVLGNR